MSKEQCFESYDLPEEKREAFYAGWYAAGAQINEGEDSDDLQLRLEAFDFLRPDE